jgi:competence protein ComGF
VALPIVSVYFLVATTSVFIQVACSRVQPRKVTIEKKDEINEYKNKKKYKEKEKTKRRAYQCPPPFIMEYLC